MRLKRCGHGLEGRNPGLRGLKANEGSFGHHSVTEIHDDQSKSGPKYLPHEPTRSACLRTSYTVDTGEECAIYF